MNPKCTNFMEHTSEHRATGFRKGPIYVGVSFHRVPDYGRLIAWKALYAGTSHDSCRARGQDKRDTVILTDRYR
jgi:hypothetical protein